MTQRDKTSRTVVLTVSDESGVDRELAVAELETVHNSALRTLDPDHDAVLDAIEHHLEAAEAALREELEVEP